MPQKRLRKKTNDNEAIFLFIAFWTSVIIECISLYKKEYSYYAYSRIWVVPVLLVRLFRSQVYKKVNIYIWLSFLFALSADITTIFGNYTISYIGLSLFTASYLSIGCFYHQLKTNHNKSHLVFILATVILLIVNILWLYAPELHHQVFYLQVIVHSLVLAYLLYSGLILNKKLSVRITSLFLIVNLILILTNMIYGLDILYFHRNYAIVDSIVGLGNGVYLFLFTRSVIRYIKMNINSIG